MSTPDDDVTFDDIEVADDAFGPEYDPEQLREVLGYLLNRYLGNDPTMVGLRAQNDASAEGDDAAREACKTAWELAEDEARDWFWKLPERGTKPVKDLFVAAVKEVAAEEALHLKPYGVDGLVSQAKRPSWGLGEAPALLLGWRPTADLLTWARANAEVSRGAEEIATLAKALFEAYVEGEFEGHLHEVEVLDPDCKIFVAKRVPEEVEPKALAKWAWDNGFFVHLTVRKALLPSHYEYSLKNLRGAQGELIRLKAKAAEKLKDQKSDTMTDKSKMQLVLHVMEQELVDVGRSLSGAKIANKIAEVGVDITPAVIDKYKRGALAKWTSNSRAADRKSHKQPNH